ncbi:MAG: DUF2470 domain-containing protein [Alphaproteobacteria bacterium]|nr:DUF2470 domain-containing protein [Alphaproteobacteria bacterium]
MSAPSAPPASVASGPPPGVQIRRLIRAADRAALATLARSEAGVTDGAPYVSLVLAACDHDASPILLISMLADHTRNIVADDRVSLLFDGTAGLAEPLTGARATVQGRARRSEEPRHRARYLARHPSAAMYAGFRDFGFYRVEIERAHLVAGFGRIHWVEATQVVQPSPEALIGRESDIVEHMNTDHADAVDLYASALLGRAGAGWRMTGVDTEGADLRREGETARLEFARPVEDAEAARAELVRLVRVARNKAGA